MNSSKRQVPSFLTVYFPSALPVPSLRGFLAVNKGQALLILLSCQKYPSPYLWIKGLSIVTPEGEQYACEKN